MWLFAVKDIQDKHFMKEYIYIYIYFSELLVKNHQPETGIN